MPLVRGAIAQLLAPGLNMSTFSRYREKPEQYRRVMNVLNSTKAYEENAALAGLGPLAPKGELVTTKLDRPFSLDLVRYIHKTYALAIAYSKEMKDDDQTGRIMELAGELGKSSRFTAELYGHDVYNQGFNTTYYTGRDGLALFSTAHTVSGTGGTIANTPAVAVDLSSTALEAAMQSFENQIDDRGMPMESRGVILLISPENRMLAKRILQSSLDYSTPNNSINPLYDEGIRVVVSNYLVDKDAWFLLAEPSELGLKFYWREMPDTKTWDDDDADATFHKIRQRHSVGFDDWRHTYGSPGA